MNIIGIEVLPGNPGVNIGAVPSEKVEITYDQTLRINTRFDYRGRSQAITLYGAIGQRGLLAGFDEIISSEVPLELPESPAEFVEVKASVDIPITADIAPKPDYDIYCKIKEYPEAGRPEVDDVIDVIGVQPTFTLLEETIYHYAYIYDGDVEVSIFTCKSDPFTPAKWIAGKLANALDKEVREKGGRMLELRVYVDQTPLLWNDWRLEVVSTPLKATEGVAAAVGIPIWAVIILAVLVIALIVVVTWSIKTIVSAFTHKPISEEIKKAWSRETLISAINDFEEKLERTPTPPEELEEKSDEELVAYCDELAQAVAPPVTGMGLALAIGAVAVLGLGAAAMVAYAAGKPKKLLAKK